MERHLGIPDQDAINVLFGLFPEGLYRLPNSWNMHLVSSRGCDRCHPHPAQYQCFDDQDERNLSLVHGVGGAFHDFEKLHDLHYYYRAASMFWSNVDAFWPNVKILIFEPTKINVAKMLYETIRDIELHDLCASVNVQIGKVFEQKALILKEQPPLHQFMSDIQVALSWLNTTYCSGQVVHNEK